MAAESKSETFHKEPSSKIDHLSNWRKKKPRIDMKDSSVSWSSRFLNLYLDTKKKAHHDIKAHSHVALTSAFAFSKIIEAMVTKRNGFLLSLIHTSVNVCVCVCVCVKMLTLCLWGCCVNTENGYRTHSLHLCLHQIVYGNTILQFDANANVEASGNEVLPILCVNVNITVDAALRSIHTSVNVCVCVCVCVKMITLCQWGHCVKCKEWVYNPFFVFDTTSS